MLAVAGSEQGFLGYSSREELFGFLSLRAKVVARQSARKGAAGNGPSRPKTVTAKVRLLDLRYSVSRLNTLNVKPLHRRKPDWQ